MVSNSSGLTGNASQSTLPVTTVAIAADASEATSILNQLPDFQELTKLFEGSHCESSKIAIYNDQVTGVVARIAQVAKQLYSQVGQATTNKPSDDSFTLVKDGPKFPVQYYHFANAAKADASKTSPGIYVFMDGSTPRLQGFRYELSTQPRTSVTIKFAEAGKEKSIDFIRVDGARRDGLTGSGTFGIHANALTEQYPSLA